MGIKVIRLMDKSMQHDVNKVSIITRQQLANMTKKISMLQTSGCSATWQL
jgi:hypothetical protein